MILRLRPRLRFARFVVDLRRFSRLRVIFELCVQCSRLLNARDIFSYISKNFLADLL